MSSGLIQSITARIAALKAALLDTASASNGAGAIGFLYATAYAGNTIGAWLKGLANGTGAGFIGWMSALAGAVLRTLSSKLGDVVSVKDFGAVGDGATDDTAAITAAFAAGMASGKTVYFPEGTYVTGKQTITANLTIRGAGRFVSAIMSKAGTNDHGLYVVGDFRLTVSELGIDGNYANNPTLAPNYPCGVLVPIGSLDIRDCYVHGWRDHAIHTGNTDYQFDSTKWAHDVFIIGNLVDQGNAAAALYDCIRIHRTKRARVAHNICTGGDSSIRTNYYCDGLDISNNHCSGNWNDVGVTAALSDNVTIVGNTCLTNGQHGVEIDGVRSGLVSGNVCRGNTKNGIMITEYGPPAGASYQGQYNDGTAITNPNLYSNVDVRVHGNVCVGNGQFGIRCTGQSSVTISDNTIEGNNTAGGNPYGLYIEGGTGNKDDVEVVGNVFRNTGNQTASIGQASVQFQTRTGGNFHTPGTPHWAYAPRGKLGVNALFNDPFLLNSANVQGGVGTIVEDTTSPHHFARQINDSSATASVTLQVNVNNLPAAGEKLVVVRIRTADTMTKCTVNVNLFQGSTFEYTVASTAVTGLGAAWREFLVRVPDSLKSYAYNAMQISVVTDATLTGTINVDEVSVYGCWEA